MAELCAVSFPTQAPAHKENPQAAAVRTTGKSECAGFGGVPIWGQHKLDQECATRQLTQTALSVLLLGR